MATARKLCPNSNLSTTGSSVLWDNPLKPLAFCKDCSEWVPTKGVLEWDGQNGTVLRVFYAKHPAKQPPTTAGTPAEENLPQ